MDNKSVCSIDHNVNCWSKLNEDMNRERLHEMAPVIVVMCIFMIVGVAGNILVLFVYSRRKQKSTANIYIMFLAAIDLLASMLIHPYIIYKLHHNYDQTWVALCKLFEFFIHGNLMLSGLVLLVIAVDRYVAICKPVKYLIFDKHVNKCILSASVFSMTVSLPILEFYGSAPERIELDDVTFISYRCHYQTKYNGTSLMFCFGVFVMLGFIVEVIVMVILYKNVAVTAYRSRNTVMPLSNAHILAGIKPSSTASTSGVSTVPTHCSDTASDTQSSRANLASLFASTCTTGDGSMLYHSRLFMYRSSNRTLSSTQLDKHRQHERDRNTSATRPPQRIPSTTLSTGKISSKVFATRLKAAKMLFMVTAVFLVSWMPFFTMRTWHAINPSYWQDMTVTQRVTDSLLNHFIYINNAANPIIYTIINKSFRGESKQAFKQLCCRQSLVRQNTRSTVENLRY